MSEVLVAAERLARGCEEWGRVAKMPTEPCSCDVDEKPPFRKRHSADPGDAGYCMYYVNALYEEAHAEVAAALKAYRALSPAPTPAEGER